MEKITVVKFGGSTLGSHDTTIEDIVALQRQGVRLVIVHGGGKLITEWLSKQGIESNFSRGERVTDIKTLEVVVSVLAGLVNKDIVAAINSLGGQAVGVSGVDGALIQGQVKDATLGYVGTVVKINLELLATLLDSGYVPVVAPIGFNSLAKSDELVKMLNINADLVAGEVARAAGVERLIFLTDVAGICDESGELLSRLSASEIEALLASGVVSGGMIPKTSACLRALASTGVARIIDGRQPHALLKEIEGSGTGTTITSV
jgi:acetylglutamate kinase